ncbi:MAG TPA: ATPase, T2SS/T4P/T4SS family, partial [Thermaerobacter sp.]
RMRPDRLVVGEVRGEEAFDLMQALNTGHSGSVCTIHANGPLDALRRLEQLVLMAGEGVPATFVREQVYRAIHVLVHQVRLPDGRRVVREIVEVDADHRRLRPVPGCEPPAGAAPAGHGGAVRETGAGEGRGP